MAKCRKTYIGLAKMSIKFITNDKDNDGFFFAIVHELRW